MATWECFADWFGPNYSLFIAIVAHLNVFLGCLSYAWPSPVLIKLFEPEHNPLGNPITEDEGDSIAAIFYIGAATGPLLFYRIVEIVGRRKIFIASSVIPPITYGILVYAETVSVYFICRVFLGLSVGVMFSVQAAYVSEILAEDERPFLMSLITTFGFSGVFTAMIIGPFVSVPVFNGIIAVLSLMVALLTSFGFPETPYFLMKNEGEQATRELLQKLRIEDVESELQTISSLVASEYNSSCIEIFSKMKNFKAFMFSSLTLLLQAYSGIPLILNFCQLIFKESNMSIPSEWSSIIVIGFFLCTTFFAPALMNKNVSIYTLLVFCLSGIAICDFIMGIYLLFGKDDPIYSLVPLVTLIMFVLIYNCGLDPIPWMVLGDAYPMSIRSFGTAISTSLFELSIFPTLFLFHKLTPGHMFLISSGSCLFGVIYFAVFVRSDEKKTEDIQEMKSRA